MELIKPNHYEKIVEKVYDLTGKQLLINATYFDTETFTPKCGISYLDERKFVRPIDFSWNLETSQDIWEYVKVLERDIITHAVRTIKRDEIYFSLEIVENAEEQIQYWKDWVYEEGCQIQNSFPINKSTIAFYEDYWVQDQTFDKILEAVIEDE